jgi:hypothetical protein
MSAYFFLSRPRQGTVRHDDHAKNPSACNITALSHVPVTIQLASPTCTSPVSPLFSGSFHPKDLWLAFFLMPLECAAQTSHEALPKTRRMPISISPSIVSNPVVNAIVGSAIISLCRLSCSFCVLNRFICVECLFLFRFSHQTHWLVCKMYSSGPALYPGFEIRTLLFL